MIQTGDTALWLSMGIEHELRPVRSLPCSWFGEIESLSEHCLDAVQRDHRFPILAAVVEIVDSDVSVS